jgi:hypothetical protein
MLGHSALHSGIVPVGLGGHAVRVHVPSREGEAAHSVGVDGVLIMSDLNQPRIPTRTTHFVDLLDLSSDHDHHVAVLHGDLKHLVVASLPPVLASGEEELRVTFGPETHCGGGAQRESRDDRAKLAFAIVVVL